MPRCCAPTTACGRKPSARERLAGVRGYWAYEIKRGWASVSRFQRTTGLGRVVRLASFRPLELAPLGARAPQHAAPHTRHDELARAGARLSHRRGQQPAVRLARVLWVRPEGACLPTRCLLRRCPNLRRLPEDIDEWTIEDLRGLVVNPAPAFPAESPETKLQVTLADFRGYLESVGNPYRYLTANRPAAGGCNGDGGTSSSAQDTPSLAGVPEICFRNDFDLAQPDTFAFFSPPEQPHATMVMLERLAQWLDQVVAAPPAPCTPSGHVRTSPVPCQPQVELTLLNEVSTRSDGFFEALESYDHLSQQVALGRSQIEALRLRIRALEVNLVEKSLSLPRLVRQRANTAALHAKLRLVHAVWRTQPTIQQLLAAGDFPGALELITSSQQLLDTGALPNHPR